MAFIIWLVVVGFGLYISYALLDNGKAVDEYEEVYFDKSINMFKTVPAGYKVLNNGIDLERIKD